MERKPKQPAPAPWLKLPGETAKAYEAFARFRDLRAARSYTAVARIFNCSKQNVARWAGRWKWQERCLAYDRQLDAMHVAELIAKRRAERRAMESRRFRHTIGLQRIALVVGDGLADELR
jgi:hypothetical protein